MRTVVTGGAGFIGSHVVEALLARGDEVHVLDDLSRGRRENLSDGAYLHLADIREPLDGLFTEIRPEVVFHLAAQIDVRLSVTDPFADAQANVLGTLRVLEAARPARRQRGLHLHRRGDLRRMRRADHRDRAAAPVVSVRNLEACRRGVPLDLEPPLRHGPRCAPARQHLRTPQDPHGEAGVVSIFLQRLREGAPATIYGDGSQTRDYVYAGDVARAMLAARTAAGGVFNVGTALETSVNELWDACCRAAGATTAEAERAEPRLGEIQRSVLDPTAAGAALNWRATTSLDEGLRATWEWLREE